MTDSDSLLTPSMVSPRVTLLPRSLSHSTELSFFVLPDAAFNIFLLAAEMMLLTMSLADTSPFGLPTLPASSNFCKFSNIKD